jgi:hypothetical protein
MGVKCFRIDSTEIGPEGVGIPKMAYNRVCTRAGSGEAVSAKSLSVRTKAAVCSWLAVAIAFTALGTRGQAPQSSATTESPTLDFQYFKTKVEPIFLEKREGHTRCYICHAEGSRAAISAFRLQRLAPDATFWTDEQSRANFELVSKLVIPGEPLKSRFVVHTLSKDAGGDFLHQGGRQFLTQDDPDWKILAAWVNGAKATEPGQPTKAK